MEKLKRYNYSKYVESNKRTKEETIKLFKKYAYEFEKQAHRNNDLEAKGKAEAYNLVVFELERNTI